MKLEWLVSLKVNIIAFKLRSLKETMNNKLDI